MRISHEFMLHFLEGMPNTSAWLNQEYGVLTLGFQNDRRSSHSSPSISRRHVWDAMYKISTCCAHERRGRFRPSRSPELSDRSGEEANSIVNDIMQIWKMKMKNPTTIRGPEAAYDFPDLLCSQLRLPTETLENGMVVLDRSPGAMTRRCLRLDPQPQSSGWF